MNRFQEHVEFVRRHSPYYRELYREVPAGCPDISRYPIVNQQTFWQANEDFGRGVLTGDYTSGIVFKSGGTSGNPKYSFFTAGEWDSFTTVSGWGFTRNGVRQGDRIANLFYAGELYASFIYVTDLIKSSDVGITFPISGQTPVETSVAMMEKLGINVLAGVPTTFMKIISYLQLHPELRPEIELFLFGGEALYEDQLRSIAAVFPRARVNSILY
ncbi:MAG TPA: phenylacetate--CoA ligase family protein, partial [Desulfobulbus sp.]|nr:phenylacetate--CoA ligase family protein [Desulfobulbus sp.]